MKISILALALLLAAALPGADPEPGRVTLNGWFSDKGCAASKLQSEDVTPNGTACVKKCLDDGAAAVFVDPKARAMYEVRDYVAGKDDVGFYLEVKGVLDPKAKTIAIESVKRLGEVVQMCGRKKAG